MLIPITIHTNPDGTIDASAPSLPSCEIRCMREEIGLPTLRLLIEDALTLRLLDGKTLPAGEESDSLHRTGPVGERYAHVNINVGHLVALAKHQKNFKR